MKVATLAEHSQRIGVALLAILVLGTILWQPGDTRQAEYARRREVVFWHLWGGKDRPVVEEIVRRFNDSQEEHFVRAVAVPGQNLDLKFFLGVAGENPPDLLNQDDPVVADWAARGVILPIDQIAGREEARQLTTWLFPAARAIGSHRGRLYAVCNGLDVRALYYDRRLLDELGLSAPTTLAELDQIAERVAPAGSPLLHKRYGFLPDPRRLWAWGIVFGGQFHDPRTGEVLADSPRIVEALEWMAGYSRRYGASQVSAFRQGDQALTGAAFPLLQGRYAVVMDGQWRVAEMAQAQRDARRRGRQVPEYGVVPLPAPPGGRKNAGWVNGNFFVVPRGARNSAGAWEFMKFWSGYGGHARDASRACVAGGWIPAAQEVVDEPEFQDYLREYPAFRTFVELAASPNQVPTPSVPGAAYFDREITRAAEEALVRLRSPREALQAASERIRRRLRELGELHGSRAEQRP